VRLSAFSVVDADPADGPPNRERLAEVLELGAAADRAGLDALWIAEHHFQASGVCPSPPVLLAALAVRTRRLGLGSLVSVLPFHNAIELAEQFAMVDRLSGGRLRLGLGSGYIPREFEGFGVDPATKRERFDREFDILIAALEGREVRAAAPGAGAVRINVTPVQRPRPPVWIAVQRREAIPFVARRGASLALIPYATLGDLEELAQEVREFRAAVPAGAAAGVAAAVHVYAGAHPELARAALARYLESRRRSQSPFFEAKARRDPHATSVPALEAADLAVFGAPQEVARRLAHYADAGVDELLGIFDFGGLPIGQVRASVAALGRAFGARAAPRTKGPGRGRHPTV